MYCMVLTQWLWNNCRRDICLISTACYWRTVKLAQRKFININEQIWPIYIGWLGVTTWNSRFSPHVHIFLSTNIFVVKKDTNALGPLLAWYATLMSINTHPIDQSVFYFIHKLSNHSVVWSVYRYLLLSVLTGIQKDEGKWILNCLVILIVKQWDSGLWDRKTW